MIVSLLARRKHKKQPAALPEGLRIYAVGDVHGRADLLDRLLSRIDAHMAAHPVAHSACLFIGDYIDRGPYDGPSVARSVCLFIGDYIDRGPARATSSIS